MTLDAQTLYVELARLAQDVPKNLAGNLTPETYRWLGRFEALLAENGRLAPGLAKAVTDLSSFSEMTRNDATHQILSAFYKALAKAELAAPTSAAGAFIAAGAGFEVFAAVGKLLGRAKTDLLVVDPYLDAVVLTDFAPSANPGVRLRLLADRASVKASFEPAVKRWIAQYGADRPIEARLGAPKTLHDRLVILDGSQVSILTQSLKDFAGRSPGSILPVDSETAMLKVAAYEAIWQSAAVVAEPST